MGRIISKITDENQNQSINVRISKQAYRKLFYKRLRVAIVAILLSLIVIYVCFTATLMRVNVTNHGLIPNKNITYEGGILPIGAEVLVASEPLENGIMANLKNAFSYHNDTAIVEVVAGPFGKIEWVSPDVVLVDNKNMDVPFPAIEKDGSKVSPLGTKEFLEEEYLVRCVEGNCQVGTGFIITKDHVIGSPLGGNND